MTGHLQMGRQLFIALKAAAGNPGPTLSIPVGVPLRAVLRPIPSNVDWLRDDDVRDLGDWRNQFVTHFLTEFRADPARTRDWLTKVVGPSDSKILLMVDLPDGTTVGHVGLGFIDWSAGYGEADAIVRGRDAPKGVMTDALLAAMSWARSQLGLRNLGVRVRSDNPALEFYRKLGFTERVRVPLRRIDETDMVRWVEDTEMANPAVTLVHMDHVDNG